ncbi:MAG: dihydroorotase [Flammeovirgaceae bacterium]|nr:dihydroorotase [Flammeovirgaceae bacterium]HCX24402.1 dihydroorotase [Cytophagales bacterium]|tara:strand:+ start:1615 stop:2958 length:1344 start_codon:yes stop_codon:yes gene_type:complete
MASKKYLIKNAQIVNEGKIITGDVLVTDGLISKIGGELSDPAAEEIDAEGLHLLPGLIDDQVHFREPGLTHKAEIYTEAKAAVAGGVTSYMEMPNVVPQTVTQELLAEKYQIGANKSLANYSFFMGATNDNLDEVLKTNPKNVCGIKVFMGSSTGNMLVDNRDTLEKLYANAPILMATHCEDEATIRKNMEIFTEKYGENIPFEMHPVIRSEEACYLSSSMAVELAKKHNTRLHILHISTAKETNLFGNDLPLEQKRITSEACIHHLWFSDADYKEKQQWIKWNPAVKTADDRAGIWEALLDDRIDVIATDHAPHTIAEKENLYGKAPSGGPLVQHSLTALLDFYHEGKISLERIVEKACHAVATCFEVEKRGFIREGYFADLVLVDLNKPWTVSRENVLSKCGWSPFEGHEFKSSVEKVWVSGHLAYNEGEFDESKKGERLTFDRN